MENASKALIIAGAILVSILLISIGVMVIQSTGSVQQGMAETMDSSAIQQFNSKWDPYVGKQNASTLKGLISAIIANNASSSHKIYVKSTAVNGSGFKAISTASINNADISAIASTAQNKYFYKITVADKYGNEAEDGYYSLITIVESAT